MLQKEFEERTGMSVMPEKFEEIHAIYMACGAMVKDEFCKLYKSGEGRHELLRIMAAEKKASEWASDIAVKNVKREADELRKKMQCAADRLLMKGEAWSDPYLCWIAAELVARRAVTLHRVAPGPPLQEEDKDYILEHLK